jgi:alanine-alpha-ketoisovalerate/valine-pyruvate aminotransferase
LKIYLHKILGNISCWTLWEDLFTQNTGKYFLLSTVGRLTYTKYWEILSVEHCEKIYLHKILGKTLCWTWLEDLFTQNTGKYIRLSTVGRFIYPKCWEIHYVEHCWKIYLHKILGNTLCWTL